MAHTCGPQLKSIKAIVKKFPSQQNAYYGNQNIDTAGFQDKVENLRKKLADANNNINHLKNLLSETDGAVKANFSSKNNNIEQEDEPDIVEEINLILKRMQACDDLERVFDERSQICREIIEELDNQECICAQGSPSIEQLKDQMFEVSEMLQNLDDIINGFNKEEADQNALGVENSSNKSAPTCTCANSGFMQDSYVTNAVQPQKPAKRQQSFPNYKKTGGGRGCCS